MHGILLTVRTCVSRITSCTLTPEAVVIIFTLAAMFTWVTLTLIHYNTVEKNNSSNKTSTSSSF